MPTLSPVDVPKLLALNLPDMARLEEYPFYPFVIEDSGHGIFSAPAFNDAVEFLLRERNNRAAGELIVIGEQDLIRDTFPSDRLQRYKQLYEMYRGDRVVSDNDAFLENYRRIVNQFGRSFPHAGIEILLHNLVNPSRSLVAIENGEVTGRSTGSGAINLVLDLKTRRQRGEDKVNYELNIGARHFKCTTVPISRRLCTTTSRIRKACPQRMWANGISRVSRPLWVYISSTRRFLGTIQRIAWTLN